MLMIALICIVVLVTALLLSVLRQRWNPRAFWVSDLGSIVDRSLRLYRRHFVRTIALAVLCIPLGTISLSGFDLFILVDDMSTFLFRSGVNTAHWIQMLIGWLSLCSLLGIGTTLLTCGVIHMLQAERRGLPVNLAAALPRENRSAVLGLVVVLVLPTLATRFLGGIGILLGLLWALAPTVLIVESLSPIAAFRRSITLARAHFSGLLNTLATLWLIGWVIIASPAVVALIVLPLFLNLPYGTVSAIVLLNLLLGSVFISPLVAIGTHEYYQHIQARTAPLRDLELRIANYEVMSHK